MAVETALEVTVCVGLVITLCLGVCGMKAGWFQRSWKVLIVWIVVAFVTVTALITAALIDVAQHEQPAVS